MMTREEDKEEIEAVREVDGTDIKDSSGEILAVVNKDWLVISVWSEMLVDIDGKKVKAKILYIE